jgi:hypothetical protein
MLPLTVGVADEDSLLEKLHDALLVSESLGLPVALSDRVDETLVVVV